MTASRAAAAADFAGRAHVHAQRRRPLRLEASKGGLFFCRSPLLLLLLLFERVLRYGEVGDVPAVRRRSLLAVAAGAAAEGGVGDGVRFARGARRRAAHAVAHACDVCGAEVGRVRGTNPLKPTHCSLDCS